MEKKPYYITTAIEIIEKAVDILHDNSEQGGVNAQGERLMAEGYVFKSETDTEVIPNLISYYYTSNNLLQAVSMACKDLKGSFAIEVLCSDNPDKIIVAKKDSALVIGTSKDANYIASDIPAILSYTKEFYLLADNEIAEIYSDKVKFYNFDLENI